MVTDKNHWVAHFWLYAPDEEGLAELEAVAESARASGSSFGALVFGEPDGRPWGWPVAAGSLAIFAVAAFLWRTRRRRARDTG